MTAVTYRNDGIRRPGPYAATEDAVAPRGEDFPELLRRIIREEIAASVIASQRAGRRADAEFAEGFASGKSVREIIDARRERLDRAPQEGDVHVSEIVVPVGVLAAWDHVHFVIERDPDLVNRPADGAEAVGVGHDAERTDEPTPGSGS